MASATQRHIAVSATIATLLLSAQNYALTHNDVLRRMVGENFFSIVLSAGTIVALYKLILFVYQRWGWRLLERDTLIDGKWKVRIIRTDTPNDTRDGEFEIIQSISGVKFINGINRGGKQGQSSQWNCVGVVRSDDTDGLIWAIYEIRRHRNDLLHGESEIDNGVFRLTPVRDPASKRIVRLEGQYMDAGTSQRRGQFIATKIN